MVNVIAQRGPGGETPGNRSEGMIEAPEGTSVVSILIDAGDSYQKIYVEQDDKAQMIQALRDLADMLEADKQVMH